VLFVGSTLCPTSQATPARSVNLASQPGEVKEHLVRTKSGIALTVPSTWVTASDRTDSGAAVATLFFAGDFETFDTVSVRREESEPATVDLLRACAPGSADAAAAHLAASEGVAALPGTVSFQIYNAQCFGTASLVSLPLLIVTSFVSSCRGTVLEGKSGVNGCVGAAGGDLPIMHRVVVSAYAIPRNRETTSTVYVLRASCSNDRWQGQQDRLVRMARSLDVSSAF
jgi:hypothetical protein